VPARQKLNPSVSPPAPEHALAAAVSKRVGTARYGLWFEGHARFVPLGREVTVVVRNEQSRDWLEQTFGKAVREAVAEVCGPDTVARWGIDSVLVQETENGRPAPSDWRHESGRASPEPQSTSHVRDQEGKAPAKASDRKDLFGDPVPEPKARKRAEAESGERPERARTARRWRLLSEFVVGPCNRVAHAAAMNVVEEPGDSANPLVLHGPVGTGKTHLLEGIYAGLKRRAGFHPCYVTAEEFTTKFVQAARLGKMSTFRRQFRECSALLLDNLNFLANKRGSIEEFLYTFDALLAEGQQIVVTMDCHPRLADELMPELVDRLLGGAIWGLLPPDAETRLEILRKKATRANPPIPEAVLKSLSASLCGNVRELEGAINSVRHYAKVTGRPVDMGLAREALGDLLRNTVRAVRIEDVDAAVCATLRLPGGTLQSKSRAWAVTHPRMFAIYLCRKHTAATYGEISKHFAAKTHSTAVAAEKKVRAWLERDASIAIGDRDWRATELRDRIERELQR
jgi:chromosomal replication initiator protein